MSSSQTPKVQAHALSIVCALILGGSGFAYAYSLHDKITEVEFFDLVVFESITIAAGVSFYPLVLKFTPTGFDLETKRTGQSPGDQPKQ